MSCAEELLPVVSVANILIMSVVPVGCVFYLLI